MIDRSPHDVSLARASRAVRDRGALRRGNILLEFISAYGLQVALIAGALVLLAGAYAIVARTSASTELRQIVSAAQAMFGKSSGTYKGITTAIVAAGAHSGALPKALVEGTGIGAMLNVDGGALPVHIKENTSNSSPVSVNGAKYFIVQVGDNLRNIDTVDLCSELARLQLPRLHTTQIQIAAAFFPSPGYQTLRTPRNPLPLPGADLTVGKAPVATFVYDVGDDQNNARINGSCRALAPTIGAMIVYLIN